MARLGAGGTFYNPDDLVPRPRAEARALFFERISEIAPEVLQSLLSDALPVYARATSIAPLRYVEGRWDLFYRRSEAGSGIGWGIQLPLGSPDRRRVLKRMHRFDALVDALESWGDQWCLADNWCIQIALDTLSSWWRLPYADQRGKPYVQGPLFWNMPPADSKFEFTTGWLYSHRTEEEFRRATMERFARDLDRYIQQVCSAAEQHGLVRADERRELIKHLDILIRWQCKRWTWRRIAEEHELGNRKVAVETGVKRHTGIEAARLAVYGRPPDRIGVAELIGLTVRKGRRGRPPMVSPP